MPGIFAIDVNHRNFCFVFDVAVVGAVATVVVAIAVVVVVAVVAVVVTVAVAVLARSCSWRFSPGRRRCSHFPSCQNGLLVSQQQPIKDNHNHNHNNNKNNKNNNNNNNNDCNNNSNNSSSRALPQTKNISASKLRQ